MTWGIVKLIHYYHNCEWYLHWFTICKSKHQNLLHLPSTSSDKHVTTNNSTTSTATTTTTTTNNNNNNIWLYEKSMTVWCGVVHISFAFLTANRNSTLGPNKSNIYMIQTVSTYVHRLTYTTLHHITSHHITLRYTNYFTLPFTLQHTFQYAVHSTLHYTLHNYTLHYTLQHNIHYKINVYKYITFYITCYIASIHYTCFLHYIKLYTFHSITYIQTYIIIHPYTHMHTCTHTMSQCALHTLNTSKMPYLLLIFSRPPLRGLNKHWQPWKCNLYAHPGNVAKHRKDLGLENLEYIIIASPTKLFVLGILLLGRKRHCCLELAKERLQ